MELRHPGSRSGRGVVAPVLPSARRNRLRRRVVDRARGSCLSADRGRDAIGRIVAPRDAERGLRLGRMTSIWLRPQGRQEQTLQSLIDRMAGEHRTVSFRPHLTVCSVQADLAVLETAAAYIKECGLLPLTVAKTAVTGAVITPFRAVFIEIENSPGLREFRERLRDIVGAPALIPPHISLLYTLDRVSQDHRPDLGAEKLAAIAARCADAIKDVDFTLARPAVNSTGGTETDVRSWKVIRSL